MSTLKKRLPSAEERDPTGGGDRDVIARVEDLYHSYDGTAVLNGVSLELRRGEVVLLRGDNGSGKTTLLNILTGHIIPDRGKIHLSINGVGEAFRFRKKRWRTFNPFDHFTPERIVSAGVCRTWQELRLFSTLDIQENVAIAERKQLGENPVASLLFRLRSMARDRQVLSSASAILRTVGLASREHSSADMISLGQAKKVAIARAVQTGAQILFLDEPLAGLDGNGISEIMDLLNTLARESSITLVIIEHILNIPNILSLATKVWTLSDGKLQIETPEDVRRGMMREHRREISKYAEKLAAKTAAQVVVEDLASGAHLVRIIPHNTETETPILEVSDLVVRLGSRLVIGTQDEWGNLKGLSLTIRRGESVILKAPNGWGKTTLLRALAGVYPISRGSIKLNGFEISSFAPWQRADAGLSLLQAQSPGFPALTVSDALRLCHIAKPPANIERLVNRHISDLSGGEKQMVSIWCALGLNKPVALLDEPFSALDEYGLRHVQTLLSERTGVTLIAEPGGLLKCS